MIDKMAANFSLGSLGQPHNYTDPHKHWYSPLESDWNNTFYQNRVCQLGDTKLVKNNLKIFTDNDLLRLSKLITEEMEARGYGNKKN